MLQSEFIKQYTKGNPETENKLNEMWHFAMPCDCWVDWCQWWAMVSRSDLFHHLALDMKHTEGEHWIPQIKFN